MVESGCGKPGHGPRFSYWTKQEMAGTQVRVPVKDRGKDRPDDRGEAAAFPGPALRWRSPAFDRTERRGVAQAGSAGSQQRAQGELIRVLRMGMETACVRGGATAASRQKDSEAAEERADHFAGRHPGTGDRQEVSGHSQVI